MSGIRLAAVSVANKNGEWPLHRAAGNGNLPLCEVLLHENPLGIRQADNLGRQPLQHLVARHVTNLDAIVRFVEDFGADPKAEDENEYTVLDTYLSQQDSSIEGLRYLCEKGSRVKHLICFANKEVSFFSEYVAAAFRGDCRPLINALQPPPENLQPAPVRRLFRRRQSADPVMEILNCGNVELFRYLTDNGFKIWKHFPDTGWFEKIDINKSTASWLRLFFIEWQWPVSYLTSDIPYLDFFLDNYRPDAFPALKLLLDDLQIRSDSQKVLEKLADGLDRYQDRIMEYLISKGAHPETCETATSLYLREFRYQEIFSGFLDVLASMVGNVNIEYELPYRRGKMFRTTLLHQAAGNRDNIFALRCLIEKHGLSPDGLRDSRNHTVLEHAVLLGNKPAVHYLLGRMKHPDRDLVDSLLILAVSNEFHSHDGIAKLLVEVYHASPSARNDFGVEAADLVTDDDKLVAYLQRCKKEEARLAARKGKTGSKRRNDRSRNQVL